MAGSLISSSAAYPMCQCMPAQSCPNLCNPMDCSPPGFSVQWNFPDKNTGMGCYFLPHGIFLTQGSHPGLLNCRQVLYHHWITTRGAQRTVWRFLKKLKIELPCMHACSVALALSNSLQPYGLQPARLLCPWDSPAKNTAAGYHFLLQGIFLIWGSNPRLLHWQEDLYHCMLGKPTPCVTGNLRGFPDSLHSAREAGVGAGDMLPPAPPWMSIPCCLFSLK